MRTNLVMFAIFVAMGTTVAVVADGPSVCQTIWSNWINTDSPGDAYDDGDKECWTDAQKTAFCGNGNITAIECITIDNLIPALGSGEILECSIARGLVCENADNFPIPCNDYMIRYRCITCAADPTSTTATPVTARPSGSGAVGNAQTGSGTGVAASGGGNTGSGSGTGNADGYNGGGNTATGVVVCKLSLLLMMFIPAFLL